MSLFLADYALLIMFYLFNCHHNLYWILVSKFFIGFFGTSTSVSSALMIWLSSVLNYILVNVILATLFFVTAMREITVTKWSIIFMGMLRYYFAALLFPYLSYDKAKHHWTIVCKSVFDPIIEHFDNALVGRDSRRCSGSRNIYNINLFSLYYCLASAHFWLPAAFSW